MDKQKATPDLCVKPNGIAGKGKTILCAFIVALLATTTFVILDTDDDSSAAIITVDGIKYELSDRYHIATVIGLETAKTAEYDLVIPSSVSDGGSTPYSVDEIAPYAFAGDLYLKSVTIAVSSFFEYELHNEAFRNCTNLSSVSITMENDRTIKFETNVFQGCTSLQSFTFPSSHYISLGTGAFSETGLTEITLTSNIQEIASDVFKNCKNLETVTYKNNTVINTITPIFSGCEKLATVNFEMTGAKTIADNCFKGIYSLTEINFVSGGQFTIGKNAFEGCGFEILTINQGVSSIGDNAFKDCDNLTEVYIGTSLTMGAQVFIGCSSGELTVNFTNGEIKLNGTFREYAYLKAINAQSPAKLIVGEKTFYKSSIQTVCIDRMESIGKSAFEESSLRAITFTAGECITKTISDYAFKNCPLNEMDTFTVTKNVTSLGNNILNSENIKGIQFETGSVLKTLGAAFSDTKITTVSLINATSLETIGNSAFRNCTELTALDFSSAKKLNAIGDYAFAGCTKLKIIAFYDTEKNLKTIGTHAFDACAALNDPSSYFDNVTSIGEYAFFGCKAMESFTIPVNVEYINSCTFEGCSGLKTVTIKDNSKLYVVDYRAFKNCPFETIQLGICTKLYYIGEEAFAYCTNLKTISESNVIDVITIGNSAFRGCAFESVKLTGTVISLGSHAFAGCKSLSEVTIGSGIVNIPSFCFIDCTSLTEVAGLDNVENIYAAAFQNCTSLVSVKIPKVTNIESSAFKGDTALKYIEFGSSLRYISDEAFKNCTSLTASKEGMDYLLFPASVGSIENRAFQNCTSLSVRFECKPGNIGYNTFSVESAGQTTDMVFRTVEWGMAGKTIKANEVTAFANNFYGRTFMQIDGYYYEAVTVKMDSNGGTGGPESILVIAFQELEDLTGDQPTKERYKFVNWYAEESGEKIVVFDTEGKACIESWNLKSKTLYAEWDGPYEYVTFDCEGIEQQYVHIGDTAERPEAPEKEHYILLGWYINGRLYDFDSPVMNDITLVPKWQEITYEPGTKRMVIDGNGLDGIEIDITEHTDVEKITVNFDEVFLSILDTSKAKGFLIITEEKVGDQRYDIKVNFNDGSTCESDLRLDFLYDSDKGTPRVYYYPESGDKILLDSSFDDSQGTIYVKTDHNSVYGIEYEKETTSTPWIVVVGIVLVICLVVGAYVIYSRNRA